MVHLLARFVGSLHELKIPPRSPVYRSHLLVKHRVDVIDMNVAFLTSETPAGDA